MKNSRRIATSGIAAALSVVLMYLAGITEMLSLSGVIIAAFAVMFIYIEYGTKTALSVYAAVSVISLLILPDKFSAAVYVLYAGYYPVLKSKFESRKKAVSWVLKLGSFNLVLILMLIASRFITAIEADLPAVEITVFVLANVLFVLADVLAGRITVLYIVKYRPRLQKRGLI